MIIKKIANGVAAIFIIAAILLISDLNNRENEGKRSSNLNKDKSYKLCFVHYSENAISEDAEKGVRDELKNQGLIEGENYTLKVLSAQGDMGQLNSIAETVASEKWDIVFTASTPTLQVFAKKITNSPIVFTNAGDPIGAGVGESFEKHLPNLTGICTLSDFDGMAKMLVESMPQIKSIGTIYTPGEINSVKYVDELKIAASKKGLNVVTIPANSVTEVSDASLSIVGKNVDAIVQIADNLTANCCESIIKEANNHNIPYFGFISSQLEKGAVATLARDYHQAGVDAARLAFKILSGKSPGEIPIQYVSQTIVAVNTEVVKHYKLKIPEKYFINQTKKTVGEKKLFDHPIRIAMVHYAFSVDCNDVTVGLLKRLNQTGHVQNGDFTFDEYNANADITTLNNIVDAVANKKYDLIFSTVLASTQALTSKITDVPILFTVVADPVGNGLGSSYSSHKPNITGIDGMSYTDKGIELLKKYMPDAKNIGLLYCPGEMASISGLKELERSCKENKMNLISIPVNSVSEVSEATATLCSKHVDAICQMPDNCTIPSFASMVKITRAQKVPLFCYITSQVEMGAVAAIAGDFTQQGEEIADIGIEVINGKSPADIPFRKLSQIKTVINTEAAKAYGLETPKELLNSIVQIVE
jgi:ABC-type uncharacterized transport system substrate-binding protein